MYAKTYTLAADETLTDEVPPGFTECDKHYVVIDGAVTVHFYAPGQSTPAQTVSASTMVRGLYAKVDILETGSAAAQVTLSGK